MAVECATSVASDFVWYLGKWLMVPIGRQFGYVLCYNSYIEDLRDRVEDLNVARENVLKSVNEAIFEGKVIYDYIKNWLENAETKANKAKKLLEQVESAENASFHEWLPNPMVRHPIGRQVKKMTKDIQVLYEKSQTGYFQKVYHEYIPNAENTSAARSGDKKEDVLKSRALIMKKVMEALADDKLSVIGVYGPGGVGKSRLSEDIARQVKENKLFNEVVMVKITRNQDIKKIQEEIAYKLHVNLTNVEAIRMRADFLCERIERDPKKNILIIFDNIWKKLHLKEIGIPYGDDDKIRGCKLLLTSRYRDILRSDMGSDRGFQLEDLPHGEARRLFENIVGDKAKHLQFEPLVDRVVQNCGGLPLLIVSLAKRLKDQELSAWNIASTSIGTSEVESLLTLNYEDLEDEGIKSLFLVCALTSGRISFRDSLVYCMGLGLIKKFTKTLKMARDSLETDLCRLRGASLLQDSDDMERFKIHDVFVDVAISIASREWNALVGREDNGFENWSEEKLRESIAISLPFVGIDKLPEKLVCPNLRMLLLFEHNPSLKIPKLFFEFMENLQVLDITGFSFTSLPSSIELLGNLKSLCLDGCHLEDVTVLAKLKGLQFLSFFSSAITRLPIELRALKNLRFLDLTECTSLKVIDPGLLGNLVNLEELYMRDSFNEWEAEDEAPPSNASLAELKHMKNLSTLYIDIPHSANLPRDLPFGNLQKYKIRIGNIWDWGYEYEESRTLKLKLDSGNLLHEDWLEKCLERTQDLHLAGLHDKNNCVHDLCDEGFPKLKHLHIQNSPSFQYIYSTENVQRIAFMMLESLFLRNLNNLEKICRGCLAPQSFSKLKIVKVDNCGEIKHLFPLSKMRISLQIEEIEINRCPLMQQIVVNTEANEDADERDDGPKVKACNLRKLTLRNLPEMTSFCRTVNHSVTFLDEQQVALPGLESLTLSDLPKLKEIWNTHFPPNLSNLKFLKVEDCKFISNIIPSSLLIKLQNLETIRVKRCQLIREVFDLEGLIANGDVEILSRLTALTLSDLPNLGCIWNKNPRRVLCFKNLGAVKVQNCEKLRFLFSASMVKALKQIKEINIANCKRMEDIVGVQEEESDEAATTGTLEFPWLTSLSLEELPNLRTFSSFKGKKQSADTGLQQESGHINSGLSLPVFFNEKVLFPRLEELKFSSMRQLKGIWHNQLDGQSFSKLASLTVEYCENLIHIFPSNSMDRLPSLNKIEVVQCSSLVSLFELVSLSAKRREKTVVLSALKKLRLLNLPQLRDILKSDCKVTLEFPKLMEVQVRGCHSLPHLFSSATARTLYKLVVLDVSCCNNLRSIIVVEEGKVKIVEILKFHHLSTLKLGDLENLISFSSTSCAGDGLLPLFDEKLAFPKLEELHIKGVQQKELWNDKIPEESFCCLKVLEVKQCHRLMSVMPSLMWKRLLRCMKSLTVEKCPCLRNLFTMSMAKSLGQLQNLCLGGCGEMEHIVAREEEQLEEAADRIAIPQLLALYLHNMPKLISFYQGNHISKWPSLKEFTVEDCKAVEVILGDASYRKLEGSILTQQSLLLVEKVEFPNMESMKILRMDNMKKIWLDDLPSNAFSKLKTLVVKCCEKLSSIFSSYTMLTRFQNLEKIAVIDCGSLEVVFHIQEFNFSEARSTSTFQLRELVLTQLPKMKHVWSGLPQVGLTFECLECIMVGECESLKILFPSSMAKSMTQLKELLVWDCGVEEIVVEEDGVGTSEGGLFFPRLTDLRLLELPELKSFCRNSHTSTWPLLRELQVRHCGKMRPFSFACEYQSCQGTITSENQPALFSSEKVILNLKGVTLMREDVGMLQLQHYTFVNLRELTLACYCDAFPSNFLLQRFPFLEELTVICGFFEEIFPEDAFEHGGATPYGGLTDVEKPLKAPENLKQLGLEKLCNLKRLWKDGSLMAKILNQIEILWFKECPSLLIMFPFPTSVQSLTILNVEDCAGLVHIGTCSATTSLVHLTWLTLRNCGAMKDVVTYDGNGVDEISFPKLQQLILDGLPSLGSFSPANCAFRFPSLVSIIVKQCPQMKIFCEGALRTPNLDKVLLSNGDDEWRWEGDLNTTIRTLSP